MAEPAQNQTQTQTATNETSAEKTFTQADVNRMMAAEKESGRKSILKELGITDVASAKEGLQKYQEYLEAQKSEVQKIQETNTQLQEKYNQSLQEISHAKNCMHAMKLGVNPDSVEELVILASSKVTEGKDFETVVSEMKNNSVYAGFFKTASVGTGQGGLKSNPAQSGEQAQPSLAENLAKRSLAYREQKSSYFKIN